VSQLRRGTSQGDLGALLTAGGGQKRAERLTVEDYMRILTFEGALTPKTYSNLHDRFARKLRDELESKKERTHEYFLIKEHMEKMDKVLAFAATDISTRPSADLQDDLKVINAIVGTWPTNIKDAIMARRISDLGEINDRSSDAAIKEMMLAIVPWKTSNCDGDVVFDPLNPSLSMMDGSQQEKANKFKKLMLDHVISKLLSQGPPVKVRTLQVCSLALDIFRRKPDDLDDDVLAMLFTMVKVLKGLISLCDGADTRFIEQGCLLMEVRKGSGARTTVDEVAAIIRGVPSWKDAMDDLVNKGPSTREHLDAFIALQKQPGQPRGASTLDVKVMSTALSEYSSLAPKMRFELSISLKKLLVKHLDRARDDAIKYVKSLRGWELSNIPVGTATTTVSEFQSLFKQADGLLDLEDFNAKDVLKELDSAEQLVSDSSQCQSFVDVMGALRTTSPFELQETDVQKIYDHAVRAPKHDATMANAAAPAAATLCDFVETEAGWEHPQLDSLLEIGVELGKFQLVDAKLRARFHAMKKAIALKISRQAYARLGTAPLDRAHADSALLHAKSLLAAFEDFEQAISAVGDNFPPPGSIMGAERGACSTDLKEIYENALLATGTKINHKVEEYKDIAIDAAGISKRWTDQIGNNKVDGDGIVGAHKLAKKTLLQLNGDELENKVSELKSLRADLVIVIDTFGRDQKEVEFLKDGSDFMKCIVSGSMAVIEAKLMMGYGKFNGNQLSMHKFVVKLNKEKNKLDPPITMVPVLRQYMDDTANLD
ncbi:unnamed protein product, partial [Prorocentrum cordatum]